MKQNDFQKVANQVSFVTIVVNILLAFMKLLAGVFAHSNAMISDSIHSASDVFSTMIVVIGIKLSSKQPDKEHPYGHERMECVAAIVLSMVLFYDRSGDWRGGALRMCSRENTVTCRYRGCWRWQRLLYPLSVKKRCTGTPDIMRKRLIPAH
ncbi:MAG: cation diffusion facilitator family transporter [Clostridium fessum]